MCQSSESHLPSHQSLPLSCSSIFQFISLPSALVTALVTGLSCLAWGGVTLREGEARGVARTHYKLTVQNIKADFLKWFFIGVCDILSMTISPPRLCGCYPWLQSPHPSQVYPGPSCPGPRASLIRSRRWSGHWKTWGWFPSPLLSHITALLVTIITKRSLHLQTALWHISIRT